jgi:hypothetical protein
MWGHARMPLRIAPAPLTPSNDPQLGVESRYQKLHRCALDGFLGPSSKLIGLTRILQPFVSKLLVKFLGEYYIMFDCIVPNFRICLKPTEKGLFEFITVIDTSLSQSIITLVYFLLVAPLFNSLSFL